MWLGIAVFVLGIAWDGVWHSSNPEALETGWNVLEAHGVMYAGVLVALVGSLVAFREPRGRPSAASWYGLTAAGALAQAVGTGWDAVAHALGSEAALAHLLARVGLLALLAGAAAVSIVARTEN